MPHFTAKPSLTPFIRGFMHFQPVVGWEIKKEVKSYDKTSTLIIVTYW